jgi:hypothetical protein
LLDDKTLQFAVDFAQIVLKSYVMDQVSKLVNQKTSHPDGTVTGKATIDAVGKIADMAKAAPQNNLVTLN